MKERTILENIRKAILNGEPSYEDVPLPAPQRIGTSFQRNTYARMAAEEVYDEHFRNGSNPRSL